MADSVRTKNIKAGDTVIHVNGYMATVAEEPKDMTCRIIIHDRTNRKLIVFIDALEAWWDGTTWIPIVLTARQEKQLDKLVT